ncbi:TOMM precursor leader peptide-binding protein [Homoserinibacter sp. GY 40078]|nr:TOMM precursor leader peptide-binding protein [Homoserinibacter sp. GY 40078]
MVLRLDPAIPLVWRDPQTVQLGVDPVACVVPDVGPGVERLLGVLIAGVSESGYSMLAESFGVGPGAAERLRERLRPAMLPAPTPPGAAAPDVGRAVVLGGSPLAYAITRLLDASGHRASGDDSADAAVLVADRVLLPSDHRPWLQRDIPHLAVVASDSTVTVGPFVEPGTTACIHCHDLHRRDADPAWVAIATQLVTAPPPARHPLRDAAAAWHAARLVIERLSGAVRTDAVELRIASDGAQLSESRVAPHPDCRCAAPPESDWAPADDPEALRPTTTARATAGRA